MNEDKVELPLDDGNSRDESRTTQLLGRCATSTYTNTGMFSRLTVDQKRASLQEERRGILQKLGSITAREGSQEVEVNIEIPEDGDEIENCTNCSFLCSFIACLSSGSIAALVANEIAERSGGDATLDGMLDAVLVVSALLFAATGYCVVRACCCGERQRQQLTVRTRLGAGENREGTGCQQRQEIEALDTRLGDIQRNLQRLGLSGVSEERAEGRSRSFMMQGFRIKN